MISQILLPWSDNSRISHTNAHPIPKPRGKSFWRDIKSLFPKSWAVISFNWKQCQILNRMIQINKTKTQRRGRERSNWRVSVKYFTITNQCGPRSYLFMAIAEMISILRGMSPKLGRWDSAMLFLSTKLKNMWVLYHKKEIFPFVYSWVSIVLLIWGSFSKKVTKSYSWATTEISACHYSGEKLPFSQQIINAWTHFWRKHSECLQNCCTLHS